MHGRGSDIGFRLFLCTELKRLPSEIDAMSCKDYMTLSAYYTCKTAIESKTQSGGLP